ncbi:MAG: 50S ribosomal protein L4 [Fibrobacterota bacterium]
MAEAIVYTKEGKESGREKLDAAIFQTRANNHVVYEYVKSYLNNQRQGTHKGKNRSEVSGSGAKPWRQKGTGRARSGTNVSPIWVRGGKAFPPRPHEYYSRLPKQKRRMVFLYALSLKAAENQIKILDGFSMEKPKTSSVAALLKALNCYQKKNLILVEKYDKNLFLASRNIKLTQIRKVTNVNAFDVLHADNLLVTRQTLSGLKERFLEKESD